jgi:mono/diheme cytochrome c family protein
MKINQTRVLFLSGLAICIISLTRCGSNPPAAKSDATTAAPAEDPVKRGQYLVMIGGCEDCHSPKVFDEHGVPSPDPTKTLSGHPADAPMPKEFNPSMVTPGKVFMCSQDLTAWFGPWGTSFPRNLTPDSATGTGAWTAETFIKILRSGKHMGAEAGRPIMPPMPWQSIKGMTDDDLKAVFAYLKSLKPISNNVPEYMPPSAPPAPKAKK